MRQWISLFLLIVVASPASAKLVARYRFDQQVNDSIGTRHGSLKGTAKVQEGRLLLDGEGWAELPGGMVSGLQSASVEMWFRYQRNGDWVRVFDFGNTNDQGLGGHCWYFTPDCPAGARTTFSNTDPGFTYEETIDTKRLSENTMTHVVVVYDGEAKTSRLYLDGTLIGEREMTVKLSDIGRQHLYVGKSSYNNDKLLKGQVSEFRVYDHALSPEDIRSTHDAGPDALGGAGQTAG